MKTIAIASTIAALVATLAGCAGSPIAMRSATPEQLTKESNYNLCRAVFSRHATQAIENEVRNRRIDCAPYYEAAARREAQADAALDAFANSMQRNRPVTTNCVPIGNGMNCRSY